GQLWLALGEAALLAGHEPTAQQAFETAQAWFAGAGQPILAARAALGAGRAAWRVEALPAAQRSFEAALALCGDYAGPEAVEALVELGSLLAVSLHRQSEGIACGRRALGMARRLEEPLLVAKASRTVGNLLVRANDLAGGVPLLEQALALAEALEDATEAAECGACLAIAYSWSAA